jgi:hypothetical protein
MFDSNFFHCEGVLRRFTLAVINYAFGNKEIQEKTQTRRSDYEWVDPDLDQIRFLQRVTVFVSLV